MWAVVVLAAVGCGGDAPAAKPARLHAPPITPDLVAARGERQVEYYERQVLLINKWLTQARIAPATSTGLLNVLRQSRDQSGRETSLTAGDLVANFQGWFHATEGLDSLRRATAYLIADRVLRLAWLPFALTDPVQQQAERDKLKAMGAEAFLSTAAGEMAYAGNWLHEAIQLDPNGPTGQRAALMLLETDCAGGDSPDSYHAIIQRLDVLAAAPADSEVKFTTELLEADAYRDMVALAHGFGRENADSTKFAPEAEAAKAKALGLYVAALAIDSTSRFARGGRLSYDRLASGQPLDHVRFFCFGD